MSAGVTQQWSLVEAQYLPNARAIIVEVQHRILDGYKYKHYTLNPQTSNLLLGVGVRQILTYILIAVLIAVKDVAP